MDRNALLDPEIDVGLLLVTDQNHLDDAEFKKDSSTFIENVVKRNTQLLIKKVLSLPLERNQEVIVAKLPKPHYILPREKPVPKPKAPTKWEEYAKAKGITSRKKPKLVWDDIVQKWLPRHGYRKAAVEKDKSWLIEVPGNADPYEDQFEKKTEKKSEKVAKNELQRLKNIARAKKLKVPGAGLTTSTGKKTKKEIGKAFQVAKSSTASMGRFQQKIPNEKIISKQRVKRVKVVETDFTAEKKSNIEIMQKILKSKPSLDVESSAKIQSLQKENTRRPSQTTQNSRRPQKHKGDQRRSKGDPRRSRGDPRRSKGDSGRSKGGPKKRR